MRSFESVWRISCSKFEHCAMVANRSRWPPCMRLTVAVAGSEHCDADNLSRQSATLGSEGEGRVSLDGIVRTVGAFFRHWDDTEKMWSEYERGGFRLVVIGGELRLSELRPVERTKYRYKHRRLVERWRDMRLEGSRLDAVADAGALEEGRELGLFEDMVEDSDLGCEGNLPLST